MRSLKFKLELIVLLIDDYFPDFQRIKRSRGFTLVELMTVMAIIVIAICAVIPQMAHSIGVEHAKSSARGAMQFIDDAKSLARMRNQILWIEINEGDTYLSSDWHLRLRTSTDVSSMDNVLQQFSGDASLSLYSGFLNDQIMIDGLKGKTSNGSLKFNSKQAGVPTLKVITSYGAGRIRVCSEEEKLDGIPLC